MSDVSPERRDIAGLVSDMRVDIAKIATLQASQTSTLSRLETKLDLGVFREEYERRHKELEDEVRAARRETDQVRDENLRRQGAQRVWRWAYGAAIAILGVIVGLIQAKVI